MNFSLFNRNSSILKTITLMLYSLEETTLGHIEVVEIVERFVHTSM
jgi:hypothetical protein